MTRVYSCVICGMCESRHIVYPESVDTTLENISQLASNDNKEFLDSMRVLNLLTGITDEGETWTSDTVAYSRTSASRLRFIAFILSRYQLTTKIPQLPVEEMLMDDFAQYLIPGQLIHKKCLDILVATLEAANCEWTYRGVAINVFSRKFDGVHGAHFSSMANSCLVGDLSPMVFDPLACPEFDGSADPSVLNTTASDQMRSPLLSLPDECLRVIVRFLDSRSIVALLLTCKAANLVPGIWRSLFVSTYEWVPQVDPSINWCEYYKQCIRFRSNLINRARIERICHSAVRMFDSWNAYLDSDSETNADAFLRGIDYYQ